MALPTAPVDEAGADQSGCYNLALRHRPRILPELPGSQDSCYTQGVYTSAAETLEAATIRKFDYCYEKLRLKPGDHILTVGPGWGAWFEYASRRGIKCTGISISRSSIDYLQRRARELSYDWELSHDLLAYQTDQRYDAIVIMGVIEHLPPYGRVLAKFVSLLRP